MTHPEPAAKMHITSIPVTFNRSEVGWTCLDSLACCVSCDLTFRSADFCGTHRKVLLSKPPNLLLMSLFLNNHK